MVLLLRSGYLKLILTFCNRARAYCCNRRWKKAEEDYQHILEVNPNSELARIGLEEIRQPILELPMIKEEALDV